MTAEKGLFTGGTQGERVVITDMRRRIIAVFLLISLQLLTTSYYRVDFIEDRIIIEFECLQEGLYDMKLMIAREMIEWENELYLNFEAVRVQRNLEFYAQRAGFESPENFDFDNYVVFITYGREMVALEGIRDSYYSSSYRYSVTFGAVYYENVVFFYRTAKDNTNQYVPPALGYHSYLLQENGEKYKFSTGHIDPTTWNGPYGR